MALPLDDPAFLEDPYPTLAAVRAASPLREPGGWLAATHADVVAAFRDRRLVRDRRLIDPTHLGPDPRLEPFLRLERHSLMELEPPDHDRVRAVVADAFTVPRIRALGPEITRTARRLAEELPARFDLRRDFGEPFSITVITALLGVPQDMGTQLLAWSHAMVRMYEPGHSDEDEAAAVSASADFTEFVAALLDRPPRPGVVADVAGAVAAGTISRDEAISTVVLLLNAGHEATVNALGNGIAALLAHPHQLSLVPEVGAAGTVEEILRYDPPLQMFHRWAMPPGTRLGTADIAAGDRVSVLLGAANRDPAQHPDPDRFDVTRPRRPHVAFGRGTHMCLGAPLARRELGAALEALLPLQPEPAGEARRLPGFVLRGHATLPLARRA